MPGEARIERLIEFQETILTMMYKILKNLLLVCRKLRKKIQLPLNIIFHYSLISVNNESFKFLFSDVILNYIQ